MTLVVLWHIENLSGGLCFVLGKLLHCLVVNPGSVRRDDPWAVSFVLSFLIDFQWNSALVVEDHWSMGEKDNVNLS